MICLCGRAIAENLFQITETNNLTYKDWLNFSTHKLEERIYAYPTFRNMVSSLRSEEATNAVDLLRSNFLGFLGNVSIADDEKQNQADFLTAGGVLLKPEADVAVYHIASPFIDLLICLHVIPEKYPNSPSTPVPKLFENGPMDTLEVLKESLKFFDKNLLRCASEVSYKISEVVVGGRRNISVPRQSVYDTELMRILSNWLRKVEDYSITGQCHLRIDDGDDRSSDIVISKPGKPTIVLDLVATGTSKFIEIHVDKTPEYKELLFAKEAWVVHFTREDEYLGHPYWQSDDLLNEHINMVHFWHNADFTVVRMSAHWKDADGKVRQVDNQPLIV